LLGLGGLFIAVVMFFPNGLAGVWSEKIEPRLLALIGKPKTRDADTPASAPAE
ncbi:MAG: urea ABC transporter permease subunit UrtC, partial [Pseudomonadota bacterium]